MHQQWDGAAKKLIQAVDRRCSYWGTRPTALDWPDHPEHWPPFSVAPFKRYSKNLRGFEMRTTRNDDVTKPSNLRKG